MRRAAGLIVARPEGHFWLDDRAEAVLLADGRVARQRLRVLDDRALRWHRRPHLEHSAPLCEPRTLGVVRLAPLPQAVEPLRRRLAVAAGQKREARVHLDARHDALVAQHVDEPNPVRRRLIQRFGRHDHARDVFAEPARGVEHFSVRAPVDLGVLEADGRQPLARGRRALVRREDAVPSPRDPLRRRAHLVDEAVLHLKGRHHGDRRHPRIDAMCAGVRRQHRRRRGQPRKYQQPSTAGTVPRHRLHG
mmetsp:Transcript_29984/g.79678  ORF Transcript_29984/g.79678 Transcript_29984/m.79678 type:complete len:249 (+) Transcript_29984:1071-1817(+)